MKLFVSRVMIIGGLVLLWLTSLFAQEQVTVKTEFLEVRYQLQSGRITVQYPAAGGDSIRRIQADGMYLDHELQRGFDRIEERTGVTLQNDRVRVAFEVTGDRSVAITWTTRDSALHSMECVIRNLSETEYFEYYGSGERFQALNQRGYILPMRSDNRFRNKGVGTYKPIPFIMSTQGYGVWVDNYTPGTFDLNATDRTKFSLRYTTDALRIVFMSGPQLPQILDEFTRLTGRPHVPPGWAFGLWKSRNVHDNQDSVLVDLRKLIRYNVPATVLMLDSPWEYGYNDFRVNRRQFPDPEQMFREIQRDGMYLGVWLTPFVNSEDVIDMKGIDSVSSNYAEARDQGYLVRDSSSAVAAKTWWKGTGGLVDFTNPDAEQWWFGELEQTLAYGARVFKADDGEADLVPKAVYDDGTPAREMKNRCSILYNRAMQEFVNRYLDGDGVLMVRSGYTGLQRYPFPWAADNMSDFSYSDGLPSVILATQNAAMSGLPFYGSDIAGNVGGPSKELYIRWAQFSGFTAFMHVHGMANRGPWDYDPETIDIFRRYTRLHTGLYPYIHAAAREAAETGMPLIRPMTLVFQDDPEARTHIFQYMFGPDILVAPMYQPGTSRSVYLPEGNWVAYRGHERYRGGRSLEVDALLGYMPLFVRAGAILPKIPEDVQTLIPRHAKMRHDIRAINDRRILEV